MHGDGAVSSPALSEPRWPSCTTTGPCSERPRDRGRDQDGGSTAALATQIAALAFVAGYSVFFGIGPVIGLLLLGRSALLDGRPNSMIALPILLTFSIVNMMSQAEIGTDEQRQTMTGLTLAVQGIILTLMSAKDDLIYDYESFEWDNDEAFFAYMDRLGMSGVLYSIIGLFIMFDSLNLESMAYLLTTVYLVILGIQGFSEEADARWRRGVGAMAPSSRPSCLRIHSTATCSAPSPR